MLCGVCETHQDFSLYSSHICLKCNTKICRGNKYCYYCADDKCERCARHYLWNVGCICVEKNEKIESSRTDFSKCKKCERYLKKEDICVVCQLTK